MSYYADGRVRITLSDGTRPAPCFHEDKGDGTPLCGTPNRPLEGQPTIYMQFGAGEVDCGHCARMTTTA